MPAERIGMREAREIIRLKFSGLSTHEIARRLGMARSTARETLKRAETAGLVWPLPDDMNDEALEGALYASRRSKRGHRRIAEPDWAGVHRELKRKHVTLLILWDEYIAANPGGYSYSRFCELYRSFEKTLSVTMRQTHAAGERLFVDYAGDGVPVVIDRLTGEIRMAQIFVAVLGASSFTFAKATWTQALPDWIDAHVRAFEAIGGVPELIVPDNAKTAIVKASFYDPQINRTYAEMAAHYGTAILPARPRKPRDKAKVEQAVLIVERWLLGRLRRRIFHSLADVDAALGELMSQLNERQALRRLDVTRRRLLEEVDRPALKALPDGAYEYSEWRVRRVGVDYHVDIDAHYYSVPYRFARAEVEARLTVRGVEIFHKGERIAVHIRTSGNRKPTVDGYDRWPDRLAERLASAGGPPVAVLNEGISGAKVLSDRMGTNALARFDTDVLSQPKADTVILMMGINDVGWPGSGLALHDPEPTAEAIIEGYKQLIARAHARGMRIIGATLTPFGDSFVGTPFEGYYTPEKEKIRLALNEFIRSGAFDGVIDFDKIIVDPQRPGYSLPKYDKGDHLHPNAAGYQAMGGAIDLKTLTTQ